VRFPALTARDLEGRSLSLPDDLATEPSILLIAFQRWHQSLIDGWRVFLEHAEERFPNARVYELIVLSRTYSPARPFIDGGIRSGVTESAVRRGVLTLYIDIRDFQRSLEIASTETICVLILDPAGEVAWNHEGAIDQHGADGIITTLARLEASQGQEPL